MTKRDIVAVLEAILDEAHTAVLTTVDAEGRPHARWMTPALIPGRSGVIFAVTSPRFPKVAQINAQPQVEWLFQSPVLTTVVTVRGRVNLLDNPSIRSEVLEALGPYMRVFWRLRGNERELVVLETVIEEAVYFLPMKGQTEVVAGW